MVDRKDGRPKLEEARVFFLPKRTQALELLDRLHLKTLEKTEPDPLIGKLFPELLGREVYSFVTGEPEKKAPERVGVLFSGGQAPGGHNVVAGLFDALKQLNPDSTLIGILNGPSGLIKGESTEIKESELAHFRNLGGFHLLGSGRTKIETPEQFDSAKKNILKWKLTGLVIIGGDDSNTNAAYLANYLAEQKVACTVVGVPKTIDGDLKNHWIEASFGFDTACKVYEELIGNLMKDLLSAKKMWAFIRLMGRAASHITLDAALTTQPNMVLIGEEIAAKKMTLNQITEQISDLVEERSKAKKNYGIILIPEGLIEFLPDCQELMKELNQYLAEPGVNSENIAQKLTDGSRACFTLLPPTIQKQLLLDRDPHGNVQVSKIETESLLIELVGDHLKKRGIAFSPQPFFFGYEARSSLPSNFDANYTYNLGLTAAVIIHSKLNGYLAAIHGLKHAVGQWQPLAVPLVSMMGFEVRKGVKKAVIEKALVDLNGAAFKDLAEHRASWRIEDHYLSPGPIQFYGPSELTEPPIYTIRMHG